MAMGEDPTKWLKYNALSDDIRKRIETAYPYLKVDLAVFQEKKGGVFVKHTNTGKVEKLLDPMRKPGADKPRSPVARKK